MQIYTPSKPNTSIIHAKRTTQQENNTFLNMVSPGRETTQRGALVWRYTYIHNQTVDSRLQTLDSRLQTLDSRLQSLDSRLQTLETTGYSRPSTLQTLDCRLKTLDSSLDFDFRLQTLDFRFYTLNSRFQSQILDSGLQTLDSRLQTYKQINKAHIT